MTNVARLAAKPRAATKPSKAPVSAVDRVSNALQQEIRDELLAPGQRLIEADVTKRYQVSRGVAREAMRKLAAEGVLVQEPNRGMSVKRLSRDEVVALLEVREVLAGLAARHLSQSIKAGNDKVGIELKRLHDRMLRAARASDVVSYLELYVQFHMAITDLSGNPHIPRLLGQLQILTYKWQFRSFIDLRQIARANKAHEAILKAIRAGEPDRAEQAMRRHVRLFANHVRTFPEQSFLWQPELK
jgi:DNA-binding GntR family transcriptional regulator